MFKDSEELQSNSIGSAGDPDFAPEAVRQRHPEQFEKPLSPSRAEQILPGEKPRWFKVKAPGGESYTRIKQLLREKKLHTVCEEARCPNVAECWSSGTATFMLGGDTCTRACRFCAIKTSRRPPALDPMEPFHISESIASMGLRYVVLTSVDRDDLPDQGGNHFAITISEIKRRDPSIIVEALVPDFRAEESCIKIVVKSGLDVYAHNIETVRRLQYRVRDPRAGYEQSLETLRMAKSLAQSMGRELFTKSSIMLGMGETHEELLQAFDDLRSYGVDVLTLGQYLRPSLKHLPVERFYSPVEYEALASAARERGFLYVAAGPLVRSSYKAAEFFIKGVIEQRAAAQAASSESEQGE